MNRHVIVSLAAVAVIATGCATASVRSNEPTPSSSTSSSTQRPVTTAEPTVAPDPATPVPTDPTTAASAIGEVNHIQADGEDYVDITVTNPSFHASYGSGYLKDTPQQKGNVFLQAFVTYTAKQAGASYGSFDWEVFVDDVAVDGFAYASSGPSPDLGSGDLPKGRSAKGWLLYEVPARGRVVLSYKGYSFGNDEPVFEIVLRSK